MNTTKTWKRIVSIVMAVLLFLSITPVSTYMDIRSNAATATTLYMTPNSNWTQASAWFAAYFYNNSTNKNTWVKMTDTDGDGVYECDVPSGYPNVIFCRMNPASTSLSWGNKWNQTSDLTIPTDGKNHYTIANNTWDNGGGTWSLSTFDYYVAGSTGLCGEEWNTSADMMTRNSNGTYSITFKQIVPGTYEFKVVKNADWGQGSWPSSNYSVVVSTFSDVTITFTPSTKAISVTTKKATISETYDRMQAIELDADKVFYVDTDLVDYINDDRVAKDQIYGYSSNNQGIWNTAGDAPFSYFNDVISVEVGNGNYTYPLYFGPLNYIESRYSRILGAVDGKRHGLSNWNSAANVALTNGGNINTDAVVQGLVGSTLVDGNLADPVTGKPLLYFNQTAAETYRNRGGDFPVMAYYANLKFPFVQSYDETTRVTTYSYNSATTNYAVYYDYSSSQLYASTKYVQDTIYDGNTAANDYGFYPLNEPDDTENELNHGFGAKFTIDFTVGKDGLLSNGQPVTFDFTGDDDVWVFIDGVLVLDMGGAHAMASGKIDFSTTYNEDGTISKYPCATVEDAYIVSANGTLKNKDSQLPSAYEGVDNSWLFNYVNNVATEERTNVSTTKIVKTFAELGLTDFDYSQVHTMTVFYMERGGVESNFSMEFTMVPVPSGLTLSKELNDKEINAGLLETISGVSDYEFNFQATSPNTTSVAFQNFTLTNKHTGMTTVVTPSGTTSGHTYSTVINGITNYTYAHSFLAANGDPAFIPGTAFSITETTNGIFQYTGTKWNVYDAKNGYQPVKNTDGSNLSGTNNNAAFTMGQANENTAYSYAIVFTNTMALGTLEITKIVEGEFPPNQTFTFNVYLDLDGKNNNTFEEATMYPGLVYTVDGVKYVSEDGSVTIKGGQTAVIQGIPAGAFYQVEEDMPANPSWTQTSSTNTTGTIVADETQSASFTNTIKTNIQDKVIFVEAGRATPYSLLFNGQSVTINSLSNATAGLTAISNNSYLTITGAQSNMVYTVNYSGRLDNGEIVSGKITVYTYAATHKTYVFDFGLPSDLADIQYGDGLFQGGFFYNSAITGTTATLISLSPNGNISATTGGTIGTNGSYSSIIFTPAGFMSQVESYNYTVRITVDGQEFDENNPETGTTLTGSIQIMPANTVYYEDNFNIGGNNPTDKIIFSNGGPSTGTPSQMMQSNDQSSNYGYDDAYLNGYAHSAGSTTTLVNGQYAYFTFYGTGFDLISQTNGSTAGFAIYVFTGEHTQDKLNFMNTFSGAVPTDMVFVDTYYSNGDLHQVPVASVRLNNYGQYTVYIQALATSPTLNSVSIDGIRIYHPLSDTSAYPLKAEQNATIDELRVLYGNKNIVSLAGMGSDGVFMGMGNPNVVKDALENAAIVENLKGEAIQSAGDLESIYLYGPNNEMYLPKNFGIGFSYTVDSVDWTLQLGAKAVTASNKPKSISIYVKNRSTSKYTAIYTIELTTATDLYYDLTDVLKDYASVGSTYDIIIISDSEFSSNEFVSLTTVKHAGITLS